MIINREVREANEKYLLAPYGIHSIHSRGRAYDEPPSATRTTFERDRDRIIHTTAFRRLEYKTQVFINYEGDHFRTRLTHTLEVAQLGRALAAGLGGNKTLTEAICLAHDLGHAPFGHAGEHILNQLLINHGGFNHNTQSYRVVTKLEQRYAQFPGLNLTYETREGMIKHETEYDKSDASEYEPDKQASLEAQIANFADEIAYNAHDLEDGLRARLFEADDLKQLSIWKRLQGETGWTPPFTILDRHEVIRELIGLLVTDVMDTTATNLERNGVDSPAALQALPSTVVAYSDGLRKQVRELKDFLFEHMYRHYRVMRMQDKAERFVTEIFNAYLREPAMLPPATQERLAHHSTERVIADYIAGMTDRYALDEWQKLYDPYIRT